MVENTAQLDQESEQNGNAGPGRRVAILVGNGTYNDPAIANLPGPPKDVAGLQKVLSDSGRGQFDVYTLVDEGFLEVRRTIASIANQCQANDLLLIYYSGSGFVNENRRLYLPVVDTEMRIAYATAFDCDFLLDTLARTNAGQKLVILDCCHAGAFFHGNRGIPDGLAALASCGALERSFEEQDGGVFTKCLVDGLTTSDADGDGDGRVTVDEAFEFVRSKLSERGAYASPQRWIWNLPEPIFLTVAARPVFISYSRSEASFAEPLFDKFRSQGVPAWMDVEGVQGGDDWLARIAAALESSRFVVAIISKDSLESKWFRRELEFADKRSIPILPILIDNVDLPDWFELRFDALQRLECSPQSEESVRAVVSRVSEMYATS